MISFFLKPPVATLLALLTVASGGAANAPTFSNEQLHYSINWPSGLSLGEGQLRASRSKTSDGGTARLEFEFPIDAAVPGFQVLDRYRADATPDFCSTEFDRKSQHGTRATDEKTRFDSEKQTATRETSGGGKTELKASSCGRDALTYLYYVRQELSQGRMPPSQTIFFGSAYQIRLEFAGTQRIKLGDETVDADHVLAALKGPSSDFSFEIYFLKDAARTPALVRVPLTLGTFSMELVR
jgi:hypothetical protein